MLQSYLNIIRLIQITYGYFFHNKLQIIADYFVHGVLHTSHRFSRPYIIFRRLCDVYVTCC